jgi:hypothetical protein
MASTLSIFRPNNVNRVTCVIKNVKNMKAKHSEPNPNVKALLTFITRYSRTTYCWAGKGIIITITIAPQPLNN